MTNNYFPVYVSKALAGLLIFIFLVTVSVLPTEATAAEYSVYEPRVFLRNSGAPIVETDTIVVMNAGSYLLKIYNGGLTGNEYKRVSSGVITLNGVEILSPNELNQNIDYIEKTVTLQLINELSVEVRSKPGSALIINIDGVDNNAPVITANVALQANIDGWHRSDVTVTFDCTDDVSGIASCPALTVISTEGSGQMVTGSAVDIAGNIADVSVIINLDKTLPVLDITSPADGTLVTDFLVTITGQAYDTGSFITATINGSAVTLQTDGSFSHPVILLDGLNILTVQVADSAGNITESYLSVTLQSNQAPVATSMALVLQEDAPSNLTLSANDPDGDALSYQIQTQPLHGAISGIAPNLIYTPNSNFSGTDSLTYLANDGVVDSNIATVTFDVQAVNDAPVAVSQTVSLNEDANLTIVLSASDIDNATLTYSITQTPSNGVLSGTVPNLVYTPNSNFNGNDSFGFVANDGVVNSDVALISITVAAENDAPVAETQNITTNEDTNLAIVLSAIDADGDNLTYTLLTQPTNGVLTGVVPNLTYVPNADYDGADVFTYVVNDGTIDSAIATVSISVIGVNDAPTAISQTITTNEDFTVAITLAGADPDGDALTYQIITPPSLGLLSGIAPNLTYTPNADANGSDLFTFVVNDGQIDSNTATASLSVISINDQPLITSTPVTDGTEGVLYQYQINATDPDDSVLSYILTIAPTGMSVDTNGLIRWTPGYNEAGNYPVEIQVQDGQGTSTTQSFTLTIVNTNRTPEITSTPINFVVSGDSWVYTLQAVDPDGDSLTYSMMQSPGGATFNAQTGEASWANNGQSPGNYDFSFVVEDGNSLSVTQTVTVELLSAERTTTHEGTEFWVPFSINFKQNPNNTNTYFIYLVTQHSNVIVNLEIKSLGVSEQISLIPGEVTEYLISATDVAAVGGQDVNKILTDKSIHITATNNISVYMFNQKKFTTDGFLALPTTSWGKSHIVGHYTVYGPSGGGFTRDPIIGLIASEDNTEIQIKPTMDLFFLANLQEHGYEHVKVGETFTLTLNAGQVYNIEPGGSAHSDLTGTLIESNKPIGVLGQHPCAGVPLVQACDHLVEQLPPVESLSTVYLTAPLFKRSSDTFRIIAPFDGTDIYINGSLRSRIDSQRYYEYQMSEPQEIKTTHPVLVLQYANGATVDRFSDTGPRLPNGYADPFMIAVPPSEQYLTEYTITTPADKLDINVVNIIMPTSAIGTLYQDGQLVDASVFNSIDQSDFSYAQIEIAHGAHNFKSDTPFGLYVYGNDLYETYGYLGGMAFSLPESVSNITTSSPETMPVATEACIDASVIDLTSRPVHGVRLKFLVEGANSSTAYVFSDASGNAQYCYQGLNEGQDQITITVGVYTSLESINWASSQQNLPPVISSTPELSAATRSNYEYQILALDPEGNNLTYRLVEGHQTMMLDANGLLSWDFVQFSRVSHIYYIPQKVVIEVKDAQGAVAIHAFEISKYLPPSRHRARDHFSNTPPEFLVKNVAHDTKGTVGVPYVYNTDGLQKSITAYPFYVRYTDNDDGDAADITLKNAPDGAFLDCYNPYSSAHPIWCTRRLRWNPAEAGNYQFEIHMRDARGAVAEEIQYFNVDISPNLPPHITSLMPPEKAVVGREYFYSVEIENDVPYNFKHNLDDIRVIIEEGPNQLRVNKTAIDNNLKGRIFLTWTPGVSDLGFHNVKIRVDDRVNSSISQAFTIEVINDNQPPTITSTAVTRSEVSIPYNYQVVASDPENEPLTYRLLTDNSGMVISTSGLITWTPTEADLVLDYRNIWVEVMDASGGHTVQKYFLSVSKFINRAPTFISAYRPKYAKVGMEYTHQVLATDRESDNPITYRLSSSASEPAIDSQNGTITWIPTAEGSFWLNASATDSLGNFASSNSVSWYVQVVPEKATLDAELQLTPANIIDQGESVILTIVPVNETSTPQVTLTVDGVPVDVNLLLQAEITPQRVGRIPVVATITDGLQTITRTIDILVRDPADVTPPVVEIHSPTNLSDVTAPTEIFGTVQDDNLVEVLLLYKRATEPLSEALIIEEFTELYRGPASFANEAIASLDTTMLLNGIYHILLQATDSNNNTFGRLVSVNVTGDLKVGNFSITLEDLNVPLAGFPISVSRTYDSRRRTENLDFGYGWSIDYQNVRIEESDEPTKGWYQTSGQRETFKTGGTFFTSSSVCIYPVYEKFVTVTLPNGDTEKFIVTISSDQLAAISDPNCYILSNRIYSLRFTPTEGTLSTLESPDGQYLYLSDLDNGYLAPIGDAAAWPITNYTLTTREGFVYHLNQNFGIEKIVDPNDNSVTYSDSSIVHSSGVAITFNRDMDGRIISIADPAGKLINYTYNAQGDLVTVTDRNLADSTYAYNNSHGLLDMFDPLGRQLIRNIYDADGRLIAQEDSDGNRTDFNHDLSSNLTVITNRRGFVTQYQYDDRGNVLTEIDTLGNTTLYTFDANDNQLSKTDALGNVTLATYNDKDDQLTQTDALNNTVTYTYNDLGQELTITDANGNVFENAYDARGNLLSITDPAGNIANSTYPFNPGLVGSVTNTLGYTTSYTYAGNGLKETETDALGNVTTYTYDDNNNVLTESTSRTVAGTPVTEVTAYAYDDLNRLTKTTDALGNITQQVYDLAGNKVQDIDALGQTTNYDYDAYQRLLQTTYPDTSFSVNAYDGEGNLTSETDRDGNLTTYTYGALNRLTATNYADGTSSQTEYDTIGRVTAEIDENNNRTEFEYDAVGRRTLTRDSLGFETTFSYDFEGNLISQTDANAHIMQYEYDALDNRIKTTYPDNSESSQSYDALGQVTNRTDQNGKATQYSYDTLGRLEQVTDALNNLTQYSYDEVGNKLTQSDAENRTTSWTYDALGRETSRTLPLGQSDSSSYDALGNMQSHTDFNGQLTGYQYDQNNRIARIDYADGTFEAFTYNNEGQRISAITREDLTQSWSYDHRQRLTQDNKTSGDQINYQYDSVGNRIELSITPNGGSTQTTGFGFDALNRLVTVTDSSGLITSYGYNNVGNRATVTYPNGNVTNYIYNAQNRLTQQTTSNGASILTDYQYTLDASGHRIQIIEASGRTSNYIYDDLYRLTTEDITDALNGNYNASYQYDTVGNRTGSTINGVSMLYTVDDNDRLIQQGGETFTYDNNGNTLTKAIDADLTIYSYNAKNELENADITVQSVNTLTSYQYDVDGIRNRKVFNGETIDFLIDANRSYAQVVRETNTTTGGITDYLYGDDLIKQTKAANDRYYLYDGLGSTRALTNSTGNVTDTYDYDSFGETLNQAGTTENNYLFTGEQFDSGLDNYYLRARHYDQSSGRFTQMDTHPGWSNKPVTLNKYLYANVDPVNNIDPSGKFSLSSLGTAFNIGARLVTQSVGSLSRTTSGFVKGASKLIRTPGLRLQYMKQVRDLSKLADKMRSQGYSSKEIAIELNKKRLALGRLFKKETPTFLKERAFKRNLTQYGNKWGPDIKYLREVDNKSWEQIITSASKPSGAIAAFISIFVKGG